MNEQRFISALEQGDLEFAGEILSSLQLKVPKARYLYLEGVLLRAKGSQEEALRKFDMALALHLSDPDLWLAKAQTLEDLGRLDMAKRAADRACRLSSDDPRTLFLCANILYRMKRFREAREQVDKVLSAQPRSAQALTLKGILISITEQDFLSALALFDSAIGADDMYSKAWTNRGMVLREIGDRDGALFSFQRALLIDPGDKTARKMMESMGGEGLVAPIGRDAGPKDRRDLERVIALEVAEKKTPAPERNDAAPDIPRDRPSDKKPSLKKPKEEAAEEEGVLEPVDEEKDLEGPEKIPEGEDRAPKKRAGLAKKEKLELECPRCGTVFFIKPWKQKGFKCPDCGLSGSVE